MWSLSSLATVITCRGARRRRSPPRPALSRTLPFPRGPRPSERPRVQRAPGPSPAAPPGPGSSAWCGPPCPTARTPAWAPPAASGPSQPVVGHGQAAAAEGSAGGLLPRSSGGRGGFGGGRVRAEARQHAGLADGDGAEGEGAPQPAVAARGGGDEARGLEPVGLHHLPPPAQYHQHQPLPFPPAPPLLPQPPQFYPQHQPQGAGFQAPWPVGASG